jgi:two-component system, OmpR family, sensor kinase
VGLVLTFELREILFEGARATVNRVGTDIASVVRGNGTGSIGEALPIEETLTLPENLDRWSSPTTYVEVDSAAGVPEAKSSNMGAMTFARSPAKRSAPVIYSEETTPVGHVLVRDEFIHSPGVALIVKVGESLGTYDQTLARTRTLLAVVVALSAIVVIVGSFALASSAVGPIDRMNAAMRQIRSDQLDRRLGPSARTDELGRLAASFDDMLDRLQEGFARERQFISDASHELKTPLTVINANAQMLERWGDKDAEVRREALEAIRAESAQMARVINAMLTLAKTDNNDALAFEPLNMRPLVDDVAGSLRSRAAEKGLTLETQCAADAYVLGEPGLLRQLVVNLTENAIKFTEHGGVRISVRAENSHAHLDVADTGPGIPEDALPHVFERFYRADPAHSRAVEGTGLGLAVVSSIVRAHGGEIKVKSAVGEGTTVSVTLPALALTDEGEP